MKSVVGDTLLYIQVLHEGTLLEDKIVGKKEDVTIGYAPGCTLILLDTGLLQSFKLFSYIGEQYHLHYLSNMEGQINMSGEMSSLASLTLVSIVSSKQDYFSLPLSAQTQGEIQFGHYTVTFKFIQLTPEILDQIPSRRARRPFQKIDRFFFGILLTLMILFGGIGGYADYWWTTTGQYLYDNFFSRSLFDMPEFKIFTADLEDSKTKPAEIFETSELKGQIVTLPKPLKEEVPDKSRFLSQYNTKVEKEMRAKQRSSSKGGGGTVQKKANKKAPAPVILGEGAPKKRKGKKKSKKTVSKKRPIAKNPVVAKADSSHKIYVNTDDVPKDDTEEEAADDTASEEDKSTKEWLDKKSKTGVLVPSNSIGSLMDNHDKFSGKFGSDDYIPNVPDGPETMLNSKRFKYWDYFNRVKEKIRQHWNPGEVYANRDPYGKIYGIKDRLTVLKVTLDDSGKLLRMVTLKPSGIDFLDDEARDSFKNAQPFPNPPQGLIDKYGHITFQFGFLFEIASSRYRFFWKKM